MHKAERKQQHMDTHLCCVYANEVDSQVLLFPVYVTSVHLTSNSPSLTFMLSVFLSDRVGRNTVAPVEEETAAEDVNVSQRRVPG